MQYPQLCIPANERALGAADIVSAIRLASAGLAIVSNRPPLLWISVMRKPLVPAKTTKKYDPRRRIRDIYPAQNPHRSRDHAPRCSRETATFRPKSTRHPNSARSVRRAGSGNGTMERLLGHRRPKGPETDKPHSCHYRATSRLHHCTTRIQVNIGFRGTRAPVSASVSDSVEVLPGRDARNPDHHARAADVWRRPLQRSSNRAGCVA